MAVNEIKEEADRVTSLDLVVGELELVVLGVARNGVCTRVAGGEHGAEDDAVGKHGSRL